MSVLWSIGSATKVFDRISIHCIYLTVHCYLTWSSFLRKSAYRYSLIPILYWIHLENLLFEFFRTSFCHVFYTLRVMSLRASFVLPPSGFSQCLNLSEMRLYSSSNTRDQTSFQLLFTFTCDDVSHKNIGTFPCKIHSSGEKITGEKVTNKQIKG